MANISKRTVSGQPRYDVEYLEPDGRKRSKTFRKKVDAEAFRSTVEADVLRGGYLDPDAGRITLRKYAEQWLEAQTFAPTTRVAVEMRLRVHILPTLGGKMLGQIKPSTVQAWVRSLEGSETTKAAVFAVLTAILSAAVDDERIAKNPCGAGSVTKPRPQRRRVVPWTHERVAAVRRALPEQHRIVLDLAAGLGLRQGEVFGLAAADVDFLRGEVQVRRQIRVMKGSKLVFALPKGGKTRTVPLPSTVRDLLAAHLAAHPARAITLPWDDIDGKSVTVDLVLSTRERHAVNRNDFNYVWRKALDVAKVERTTHDDTGMHALRHFYASVLLDAGESIKAVSEYLGHADPGFTLRTYTHLMPTSDKRTRKAVDGAFERIADSSSGSAADESPETTLPTPESGQKYGIS